MEATNSESIENSCGAEGRPSGRSGVRRSRFGPKRVSLSGELVVAGAGRRPNWQPNGASSNRKHSTRSSRPLKLMGDHRHRWRMANVKRLEPESRHSRMHAVNERNQDKETIHWSLGKLAPVESKGPSRLAQRRGKQQDSAAAAAGDESGKKSIATCLKGNFYSKAMSWQTSLVVESEDDVHGGDDDDDEENGAEQIESKAPSLEEQERSAFCQDYKSHLLACAAANLAAVAAASALPLDHSLVPAGSLESNSNNYRRAFFSYQSAKGGEAGAKRDNRSEHSLHLRLDNIRYLMERNLIATLVGVYILVSLTVIVLLLLPHLFNLSKGSESMMDTAEDNAQSIRAELAAAEEAASRERVASKEPLVVLANETRAKADYKSEWPERRPPVGVGPEQEVASADRLAGQRAKYLAMWNKSHSQPCQPMQIPFCSRSLESLLQPTASRQQQPVSLAPDFQQQGANLYEMTLLPNQFSLARQSQVQAILSRYEAIVDIKCFALMPLFLCSIFAPKCVPASGANLSAAHAGDVPELQVKLVPPCRSLCRDAFRKCLFFFEVLSLKLFDPADCELMPESPDPNVCLGQLENNWLNQRANDRKVCLEDEFRCSEGTCIPRDWRCDTIPDCRDKKDELNCSRCNVRTQFHCGQDKCIRKEQVCNGINDCSDGRDERQCLRLAPAGQAAANESGPQRSARSGRLEAFSAVDDAWVPVCGSLWSPMPMSHEACQALGYSRANETLILYAAANATTGDQPDSPHLAQVARATGNVQQRTVLAGAVDAEPAGDIGLAWLGGWAPPGAPEGQDSGEHMADIIEEAAENQAKLVRSSKWADHVVSHERLLSADAGAASEPVASADLEPAGARLKSLVAMLYHGKQAGCSGLAKHLTSTVHLRCQNFQCGRSITSYSTRVRQQLMIQRLKAKMLDSPPAAFRSALPSAPGEEAPNGTQTRQQMWEANDEEAEEEELEGGDAVEDDEFGLRQSTLPLDQLAMELLDKNQQQQLGPAIASRLVVGGFESMPGEFPYLAALHGGPDEVFFCGGVLISINWLLTAAHCVGNRSRPDGWTVKVGVTRRIASQAFAKKLSVRKIIKHSQFNQTTFNNDIALILLEEKVEFNQYLRPICLPKANNKLLPENSKDCVVVGFGKSKFGQDSNYLHVAHFVNVPIVEHSVCSSWYEDHGVSLTQGMLCAGYAEGKRDACQGDSGSGLFCRYSNTNQFFVAGLVSFGIKCATPKLPGVYTSVPSYVDWIRSTTRQHGYMLD